MRKFFLLSLFITFFLGCSKDDQNAEKKSGANSTNFELKKSLVQKGPFVEGSSILIVELNANLESTGISYSTETSDDLGSFEFDGSLNTDKIDILATGYYFNEITGQLSGGQVTLRNFLEVGATKKANVNILTTLSRQRIKYLINTENISFAEAKSQAEREVLMAFNIPQNIIDSSGQFQDMDISKVGTGNAILLAISCVLLGNNSDGQLSELITKFASDLENDGVIDDSYVLNKIRTGAFYIDPYSVRENLELRFGGLGISYDIPNFESYIDFDGNGKIFGYDVTATYPLEPIDITKPTFEWTPSTEEGKTYDVQLSENIDFSNVIFEANSLDDSKLISPEVLERGKTYYWRIRMNNGENVDEWKVSSFSVNQVEFSFVSPLSIASEQGIELWQDTGFNIYDSDPLLVWDDNMPEIGTYQFQLATDLDFNDILLDVSNITESQYEITFPLTNETNYFYRIRKEDENGVYSEWAVNSMYFTLTAINTNSAYPKDEIKGDTTPLFEWSEPNFSDSVHVPEVVQYQLQIATDRDFNDIIDDIHNLNEPNYQSTEPFSLHYGNGLDDQFYYWRIRYSDHNGILSDWSEYIQFYVSP